MGRIAKFDETAIRQAAVSLSKSGKLVTAWAIQGLLGGGNHNRIQIVIDDMDLAVEARSIEAPEVIQQLPQRFESTLNDVQENLLRLAQQMWKDASDTAESRVREEVQSTLRSRQEAELAVDQLQGLVSTLSDDVEKQAAELEDRNDECTTLKNNVTTTERSLLESRKLNEELKEELKSQNKEMHLSRDMESKAKGRAEALQQQINEMKSTEKIASKQISDLEKSCTQLEFKVQSKQADLEKTEKQQILLDKKLSEQLKRTNDAEKQIAVLTAEQVRLEKELAKKEDLLIENTQEMGSLGLEIESLEQQIQHLNTAQTS